MEQLLWHFWRPIKLGDESDTRKQQPPFQTAAAAASWISPSILEAALNRSTNVEQLVTIAVTCMVFTGLVKVGNNNKKKDEEEEYN